LVGAGGASRKFVHFGGSGGGPQLAHAKQARTSAANTNRAARQMLGKDMNFKTMQFLSLRDTSWDRHLM